MTVSVQMNGVFQISQDLAPERARRSADTRKWLLFVIFSIAVHALILMLLPERQKQSPAASPPVLEMVMALRDTEPEIPQLPRKEVARSERSKPKPEIPGTLPELITASPAVPEPALSASAGIPVEQTRPVEPFRPAAMPAQQELPVSPPLFSAAYLRNPPPRYPLAARRNGDQGTVMLRVLVSTEGSPLKVEVDRTSGFAPLDVAAAEAVRNWRFVPARRGERNIEDWVRVPIVFRLEG